jgi:hypothetical protein
MSRWHSYKYGGTDSQVQLDGDPIFVGINMLHDRGSLSAGYLARAENKRLRDGPAATRPGITAPPDFNPVFEDLIVGAGIYNNPNGDEVMLVATEFADYVWALQFGHDPVKIYLDTGQTIGSAVEFVQSFDKVLLLRRGWPWVIPTVPMLVWDGNVANKFMPMTLIPPGAHLVPIATHALPFENRILYYDAYYPTLPQRDQLLISDVLNFSSFDDPLGVFRINAGESNVITNVSGYYRGAVVVFTKRSIHLLENFQLDFTQAKQRMLSDRLGSVGVHMPLQNGSDVIFLASHDGFYRLGEAIQDQITVQPVPFSRLIQPVIDQIDWARADLWACSAALGDYAYFALPLLGHDASMANNVILVYNLVTGQWESAPDWWDDPSFEIGRLMITTYNNARRLFAWTRTRTPATSHSQIHLLYDGLNDQIAGQNLEVQDVLETRGYTVNDPGTFKRFQRAIIGVRTYDPEAEVTAISDGVNEEKPLALVTKDWQRFYVHGHPRFDSDTDDPNEPKRQDYSVGSGSAGNFVGQDFELLPDGGITDLPATPATVYSGIKQQSMERFQIRQNGRWCSLRIENSNGQCDVLGVAVEAIPAQELTRPVA